MSEPRMSSDKWTPLSQSDLAVVRKIILQNLPGFKYLQGPWFLGSATDILYVTNQPEGRRYREKSIEIFTISDNRQIYVDFLSTDGGIEVVFWDAAGSGVSFDFGDIQFDDLE